MALASCLSDSHARFESVSTNASQQYTASIKITENLTQIISNQERDFTNYNAEEVKRVIAAVKAEREAEWKEEFEEIKEVVDSQELFINILK